MERVWGHGEERAEWGKGRKKVGRKVKGPGRGNEERRGKEVKKREII